MNIKWSHQLVEERQASSLSSKDRVYIRTSQRCTKLFAGRTDAVPGLACLTLHVMHDLSCCTRLNRSHHRPSRAQTRTQQHHCRTDIPASPCDVLAHTTVRGGITHSRAGSHLRSVNMRGTGSPSRRLFLSPIKCLDHDGTQRSVEQTIFESLHARMHHLPHLSTPWARVHRAEYARCALTAACSAAYLSASVACAYVCMHNRLGIM
jgi:hypothetical protein